DFEELLSTHPKACDVEIECRSRTLYAVFTDGNCDLFFGTDQLVSCSINARLEAAGFFRPLLDAMCNRYDERAAELLKGISTVEEACRKAVEQIKEGATPSNRDAVQRGGAS
ncbi:MAG: hypothetical protein AAGJ54_11900, partial [Planctomycetota bacterium]